MDAVVPQDPLAFSGTTLRNVWKIESLITQGGFGVVYRGHHAQTRRPVAVKVLKIPEAMSDAARQIVLESFRSEAQILGALRHAAIVDVLDLSEMPSGHGIMWMVLDWIEGHTLERELKDQRLRGVSWTPQECLTLLRPVLEALAAAHEMGIAHRDLKPANVMVTTLRGGERAAKLLDFGIAKLFNPETMTAPTGNTETTNQLVAFSSMYAAPEQVGHKKTGPWTDVHAMALILTEMLVGRAPYGDKGSEMMQWIKRAIDELRPTPVFFGYDVGPWEPVLTCAMAHEAGDRYPSAKEFLSALAANVPGACWKMESTMVSAMPAAALRPGPTGRDNGPSFPLPVQAPSPVGAPGFQSAWSPGNAIPPPREAPIETARPLVRSVESSTNPTTSGRSPLGLIGVIAGGTLALGLAGVLVVNKMNPNPTAAGATTQSTRAAPSPQPLAVTPPLVALPPAELAPAAPALPAAEVPAPAPAAAAPDVGLSPMQRAQACRSSTSDEPSRNNCIINALRGHANSMQELGMLAATQMTANRSADAVRTMRTYIQRYPQGPLVTTFQRYIDSHP